MLPRVSIVIPVYNGARYLKEAIDSALAQTYHNIEVIVVNDGSDDDGATEAVAHAFGKRIRYRGKRNGGVSSALNEGIRMMTGEYFSWLSHDDVYHPHKTSHQMEFMEEAGDQTILFSDYDKIDSSSRFIGAKRLARYEPEDLIPSLVHSLPVNGCTVLIPRRCFDEVGLFNEELKYTQDYEMWLRLARQYRFEHVPECLIQSRMHSEQTGRIAAQAFVEEKARYYDFFLQELLNEEPTAYTPVHLLKTAVALKGCGERSRARTALDAARAISRQRGGPLGLPWLIRYWVVGTLVDWRFWRDRLARIRWLARMKRRLLPTVRRVRMR